MYIGSEIETYPERGVISGYTNNCENNCYISIASHSSLVLSFFLRDRVAF